jgi:hypothetical protein
MSTRPRSRNVLQISTFPDMVMYYVVGGNVAENVLMSETHSFVNVDFAEPRSFVAGGKDLHCDVVFAPFATVNCAITAGANLFLQVDFSSQRSLNQ